MAKLEIIKNYYLNVEFTELSKENPTLVFLHDSLGCVELWRDFPKTVAQQTFSNLLVYDRLGYGQSSSFITPKRDNSYLEVEADILNQLLSVYNIDNAILFGHSDGGSIALIAAAKYPSRISGVICEGAHVFVEDITLKGIKLAVEQWKTTNLKERLVKYHGDKTNDMFWAWTATWLEPSFRNWNIEYFLPNTNCPSLVIQGINDEYGTEKQVDSITSLVKGPSHKLMIPDTGHSPHKEAKDTVLLHTLNFIESLACKSNIE